MHNCKNNRAEKRRRRRRCRWVRDRDRERVRGSNEVVNINEEIFAQAQVAMFGFNIVINQLLMYLIKLPPECGKYVENFINIGTRPGGQLLIIIANTSGGVWEGGVVWG